jgi:hypothetical protein
LPALPWPALQSSQATANLRIAKERFKNNLRKLINGIPPFFQSSNEFPQVVF